MTNFTAIEKFNWCSWAFAQELAESAGKKATRVASAMFPWVDAWLIPHLVQVLQGDLEFEILLGQRIESAYNSSVQSCMRGRGKDAARLYGEILGDRGFGVAIIRRGDEIIARAVVRETERGTFYMRDYGDPALCAVLSTVSRCVHFDVMFDGIDVDALRVVRQKVYVEEDYTHQWVDWEERSDSWVESFKKAGGQRYPRARVTPGGMYIALGGWTNYQTVRVRIPVMHRVMVTGIADFYIDGYGR